MLLAVQCTSNEWKMQKWFFVVAFDAMPMFYDLLMFLFCSAHSFSFPGSIVNHVSFFLSFSFCILSHCSRSIALDMLFSKNGAYPIHWFSASVFLFVCMRSHFNAQCSRAAFMVHAKHLQTNELESNNLNSCCIN